MSDALVWVVAAVVVAAIIWMAIGLLVKGDRSPAEFEDGRALPVLDTSTPAAPEPPGRLVKAAEAINAVVGRCRVEHGGAFDALAMIANADGKVSREDLEILVWFCERQGTQVGKEWRKHLPLLNAGVSMDVLTSNSVQQVVGQLADRPVSYLCDFYAAAAGLTRPWKGKGKKHDVLGQVAGMIAAQLHPSAGRGEPVTGQATVASI